MFFSFDGVDGAGKSTQIELFCAWLRAAGHEVVTCRDPGSTRLGESLRAIVLDDSGVLIGRRAEMLLYMTARAQLVEEVIVPALAENRIVVSDRFLLSNVVYQGHAGGLDPGELWDVGHVATCGIEPTLSLVLDVDDETACARLNRPLDRMEKRGAEFRAALRAGFRREAEERPDRIVVIDAARPLDVVQRDIQSVAARVLSAGGRP